MSECPECGVDGEALTSRIEDLEEALKEIAETRGAFSRDHLTHAKNCIERSTRIARGALAGRPLDEALD